MTVNDDIDDEVKSLFESEARAPAAPADARGRVAARLASTLAAAPPVAATRPNASWGPPHAVAIASAFAIGVAAGALGVLALRPRPTAPADEPARGLSAPEISAPVATPSAPPSSSAAPSTPPPLASTPRAPPSAEGSLRAEQALLDAARVALGRGDGAGALDAANTHARRFPHGQLSEERDAIAVQALVLLGRADEARARAERFRRAYPDSALLPALREALGSSP